MTPSQRRPRRGCPGFLRDRRQASKKKGKIDSLAAMENDETSALRTASGAMRPLTCNIWGVGPLFDARLMGGRYGDF